MNDFRRYVDQAFTDNGVVELRHQLDKQWTTGWFDNAGDLLAAAGELYHVGNLFISLNRPSPRVAINRMSGNPIRNDDVQFITRLFFDFDPVRPKGCASTKLELDYATRAAGEARKIFKAMAWPDPLVAISGNGAHLIYRTHLANTVEVRGLLATVYAGLRKDYSSDHIEFDRAVRNPGRIAPLYGSIKRKGDNTPDRPHRQSQILEYPREWRQVSRRSLDGVANFYAIRHRPASRRKPVAHTSGAGDYTTLDVVAWFTAHGLYEHPVAGNIHAVTCPWEGDHESGSRNRADTTIYINDDRWPGFFCQHNTCNGRGILDVLEYFGDADSFCTRSFQSGD